MKISQKWYRNGHRNSIKTNGEKESERLVHLEKLHQRVIEDQEEAVSASLLVRFAPCS